MTDLAKIPASRVEWRLLDGWTIWADEDGCHVRPGSRSLEMPEVAALVEAWQQAKDQWESGQILAPTPPTREQVREMTHREARRYVAERVAESLLDLDNDRQPF